MKERWRLAGLVFKCADLPEEFEQIHRLNYETFVREIGQYPDTGQERLVDKFHEKNTYFIACKEDEVVGMVSVHDTPPFSVSEKLPDPSILQAPGMKPLEVRLLAVKPRMRGNGLVLGGLIWMVHRFAKENGHTHLFISGVEKQMKLYNVLGFRAIGEPVLRGNVYFTPMILDLRRISAQSRRELARLGSRMSVESNISTSDSLYLLPSFSHVSPKVREAFLEPPISHRSPKFIALFEEVRHQLCQMVGGYHEVALLLGSGTLANDAVAMALANLKRGGTGLILLNGEFGHRLMLQAQRLHLPFRAMEWDWGQPWNLKEVEEFLQQRPPPAWVWGVHLESSTGVLNDLSGLAGLCQKSGVCLCLDCVSSMGAVPIDLEGVDLAIAVSGKSLGAYPGIAIVFMSQKFLDTVRWDHLPSYLDLSEALCLGSRFTFPSSELRALSVSLKAYATPEKARIIYTHYQHLGERVRSELRSLGLPPLAPEEFAAPVMTTFPLPTHWSPEAFLAMCQAGGYTLYSGRYLSRRHLAQIATLGTIQERDLEGLFLHLRKTLCSG